MNPKPAILLAALFALAVLVRANPITIDASASDYLSFTVDLSDGHYDDTRTEWWLNGSQSFASATADWAISQSVSVSGFGGILCIRSTGDVFGGFTFFPDWWFGANGPELGYGIADGCGFMSSTAGPVAETSGLVSKFTWGAQPATTFAAATVATVPEGGATLLLLIAGTAALVAARSCRLLLLHP